jgi:hypothetical protein
LGGYVFPQNTSLRHSDVRDRTPLHIKADPAHSHNDRSALGGDIEF